MSKRGLNKFSEEELNQALYQKRLEARQQRLQRLKKEGRVVDVAKLPPPPAAEPRNTDLNIWRIPGEMGTADIAESDDSATYGIQWRWIFNKLLLLVEVGAVVGLVVVIGALLTSVWQLNRDVAAVQEQATSGQIAAVPTPTLPPVIDLVVLPTGHQPPVDGRTISYEEAGDIPQHLRPLVDAYVPPPIPEGAPQQPRQIKIGNIEVNASIVTGHEPEQLKKGVGHSIGTANPGEVGNMVLSAHNDIYGEIFRHLDKLDVGDQVVVSTAQQSYTYVINEIRVVEPTAVEVMAPTEHASLTLISCYPYLVNNKRIVVFADLVEDS